MEFLISFGAALKFGIFNMAWILIVLWGVERLWPRGEQASVAERLRALKYLAFYVVAGAILAGLLGDTLKSWRPLFVVPLGRWLSPWLLVILGPLAFAALYDFFNYWMHRAQHKWFWKQHSIHHSIEHLSGMNSYFHPTEHLFRIVCISVPLSLLVGINQGTAAVAVTILTTIQGNYIHSSTTLNLGPLSCVIVDNRWHRIHHSVEPQHFDKNFGTSLTIWDTIFGTAHFPAKEEWPAVGVHDQPEAATIQEYLLRPFRQARGKAAVGGVNARV